MLAGICHFFDSSAFGRILPGEMLQGPPHTPEVECRWASFSCLRTNIESPGPGFCWVHFCPHQMEGVREVQRQGVWHCGGRTSRAPWCAEWSSLVYHPLPQAQGGPFSSDLGSPRMPTYPTSSLEVLFSISLPRSFSVELIPSCQLISARSWHHPWWVSLHWVPSDKELVRYYGYSPNASAGVFFFFFFSI